MSDVLNQALVNQILKLPATWTRISPEDEASSVNEALDKLVLSGLAEARLNCWLRLINIRGGWLSKPTFEPMQLRFRIVGNYRAGLLREIVKGMPPHCLKDGKFVSDIDLRIGDFEQIRLTLEGERAQRDVRNGSIAFFMEFARLARIKPQIYLEGKTSNVGHFGNESPMSAGAGPHATAHADNTVHIQLGDLVSKLSDLLERTNLWPKKDISEPPIVDGERTEASDKEPSNSACDKAPAPATSSDCQENAKQTSERRWELWAIGLESDDQWHLFRKNGREWQAIKRIRGPAKGRQSNLMKALVENGGFLSKKEALELERKTYSAGDVDPLMSIIKPELSNLRDLMRESIGATDSKADPLPFDKSRKGWLARISIGYAVQFDGEHVGGERRLRFKTRDQLTDDESAVS